MLGDGKECVASMNLPLTYSCVAVLRGDECWSGAESRPRLRKGSSIGFFLYDMSGFCSSCGVFGVVLLFTCAAKRKRTDTKALHWSS